MTVCVYDDKTISLDVGKQQVLGRRTKMSNLYDGSRLRRWRRRKHKQKKLTRRRRRRKRKRRRRRRRRKRKKKKKKRRRRRKKKRKRKRRKGRKHRKRRRRPKKLLRGRRAAIIHGNQTDMVYDEHERTDYFIPRTMTALNAGKSKYSQNDTGMKQARDKVKHRFMYLPAYFAGNEIIRKRHAKGISVSQLETLENREVLKVKYADNSIRNIMHNRPLINLMPFSRSKRSSNGIYKIKRNVGKPKAKLKWRTAIDDAPSKVKRRARGRRRKGRHGKKKRGKKKKKLKKMKSKMLSLIHI